MESQLQNMKKQRNEMQLATKNVSKADIEFVNDNLEWLKSIMPSEKEEFIE